MIYRERERTAILWIEGETNRELTRTNTLQHYVNSNQLKGKEPTTKTKTTKKTHINPHINGPDAMVSFFVSRSVSWFAFLIVPVRLGGMGMHESCVVLLCV